MDEYTKDLYTMMFSLQTLQNQGITIRETVYKSLDKLLLWNKESENSKYLELALLHMQAYANMGFALDEENKKFVKTNFFIDITGDILPGNIGDNLIFTAFGAGFVHGASFYKWAYDGASAVAKK